MMMMVMMLVTGVMNMTTTMVMMTGIRSNSNDTAIQATGYRVSRGDLRRDAWALDM